MPFVSATPVQQQALQSIKGYVDINQPPPQTLVNQLPLIDTPAPPSRYVYRAIHGSEKCWVGLVASLPLRGMKHGSHVSHGNRHKVRTYKLSLPLIQLLLFNLLTLFRALNSSRTQKMAS